MAKNVSKSVESGDNSPEKPDTTIIVELQLRHFEWLERQASITGESVERMVEKLIREAKARDPYKGGTAGGGTVRAADFNA